MVVEAYFVGSRKVLRTTLCKNAQNLSQDAKKSLQISQATGASHFTSSVPILKPAASANLK
jgi:hypothetical protein